jgi:hypothetical protein
MSACLLVAGTPLWLATTAFTLSWTHSVEHTGWQEIWEVTPAGLHLTEARVRGSGAGMDPGEGARLEGFWWVWTPDLPPQPQILLAASGATGAGWRLCDGDKCRDLGTAPGAALPLAPCP